VCCHCKVALCPKKCFKAFHLAPSED
jgi:hypothetical protein